MYIEISIDIDVDVGLGIYANLMGADYKAVKRRSS